MESIIIPTSGTYSFTNCNWTNCESSDAGAITFRDKTTSLLYVDKCIFTRCNSTNDSNCYSGGAINAYNVYSISVSSSSFITCESTQSSGGGIDMQTILHQPYIINCDFISCFAYDDAGGMAIWLSSVKDDSIVCRDCRLAKCSVPTDNSNKLWPWTGGLIIWRNTDIIKCSNIIFVQNEGYLSGAYATNLDSTSPEYPLRFCFFCGNTSPNVNDVCFNYYQSSYDKLFFFLCFSTSGTNRVKVYTSTEYNNWQSVKKALIDRNHSAY